jgi:sugar lactone lactonase YvrE
MKKTWFTKTLYLSVTLLWFFAVSSIGQESIPFDSERWIKKGRLEDFQGRRAFAGHAELKDIDFQDGIIEVDLWVSGARSYPGFYFRIQDEKNNERVYIRPHRAGLYPDAVQYTPTFNDVAGWQLYHGPGATNHLMIAEKQWVTLKLEISGTSGKVYCGEGSKPVLEIAELKHGISSGGIAVNGPANGSAWFSNFRFKKNGAVEVEVASKNAGHTLQVSRIIPAGKIDLRRQNYPGFYTIKMGQWQQVKADDKGLLDIARFRERKKDQAELVMVRKVFKAARKQLVAIPFGYSDEVAVFHNSKKVFHGNSAYRSRDQSFTGIVGLNDTLYLELEEGINEIMFLVKESFGGWALMLDPEIEFEEPEENLEAAELAWQTPAKMLTPESARYDEKRDVIYISNFDVRFKQTENPEEYTGYISRLSLEGEILDLKWVDNLYAPCGMVIQGDSLFVVERGGLAEIDIEKGRVVKRHKIENTMFLNDIAADSRGYIYISDTASASPTGSTIYRFKDGLVETWLNDIRLKRINGLHIHGDILYVGNSGDGLLKAVNLIDKHIEDVACLGSGIQDSIRVEDDGSLLVSLWEGQVYRISPDGKLTRIIDTQKQLVCMADFEYVKEKNLLIVPTFLANKVVAYKIKRGE